jgi:aquaporin Z
MTMRRRASAEFLGTFWLVLGGCGSAVLAGHLIGVVGIALAFGLTVLTMAYAIGHVSGCHLNPAVTAGLVAGGRFKVSELVPYVAAQVAGAIAAAGVLNGIAISPGTLAANGFGDHSPSAVSVALENLLSPGGNAGYGPGSAFLVEALLTCFFVLIILGATDRRAPAGFAPIAIGLALTLIHLIGIPVTNLSVNPARSTGPAVFVGGWALQQLWLFWVAPIIGALIAGSLYRIVAAEEPSEAPAEPPPAEPAP